MIRTAVRHMRSALAAAAFILAFVTGPVSAQQGNEYMNQLQWSHGQLAPRTPKGLATKNPAATSKGRATRRGTQCSNPPITLEISCGNTF